MSDRKAVVFGAPQVRGRYEDAEQAGHGQALHVGTGEEASPLVEARQMMKLGVPGTAIFAVGSDAIGDSLRRAVWSAFRDCAHCVSWLTATRQSMVLADGKHRLPESVVDPEAVNLEGPAGHMLEAADVTLVSADAADEPLVRDVLEHAGGFRILRVPSARSEDRETLFRLMRRADLTVLGGPVAGCLTEASDPVKAIYGVRGHGVENVVVPTTVGAFARIEGKWPCRTAIRPAPLAWDARCDAVFAGTLVAGLVRELDWPSALDRGLAAAGLNAAGRPEARHWLSIEHAVRHGRRLPFSIPSLQQPRKNGGLRRWRSAAALTFGVGVSLLVWWLTQSR